MEDQGHQALWPQMIAALAAIDAALGLPEDGCNSTQRTLDAIQLLKKDAERYRWLRDKGDATWRPMAVRVQEGARGIDAAIDAAMRAN